MKRSLTPLYFALFGWLSACADSSSTNSIIELDITEEVEAYLLEETSFTVIEVSNSSIPDSREAPEVELLLSDILYPILLDKDLEENRITDELLPNDRGTKAEQLIYSKLEEPAKIFLLDLRSRKEQEVFDLNSKNILGSGDYLCGLKKADIFDKGFIKQPSYFYALTSASPCSDNGSRNTYEISLFTDSDSTYRIKQYVRSETKTEDSDGNTEYTINYDLKEIDLPLWKARRRAVEDALFLDSTTPLYNINDDTYGVLSWGEAPSDLNVLLTSFYTKLSASEDTLYKLWSEESDLGKLVKNTTFEYLNRQDNNANSLYFLLDNNLHTLKKNDIFSAPNSISRANSLSQPIYSWATDTPSTVNIVIRSSDESILLDGNVLKLVDNIGTTQTLKTFANTTYEYSLVPSTDSIIIKKVDSSGLDFLSSVASPQGIEFTIQSWSEEIFNHKDSALFDVYQYDTLASLDSRSAQSIESGAPKYFPAFENSAWMPLDNFRKNTRQQLILHSDDTSGGVMRSPSIYAFDALENNGQGEFKGVINADFAVIEEAAIIGERFGMIWVRESFAEDAKLKAYYFNPSEAEWSFTLVSDDTIMPDWLPYIEP